MSKENISATSRKLNSGCRIRPKLIWPVLLDLAEYGVYLVVRDLLPHPLSLCLGGGGVYICVCALRVFNQENVTCRGKPGGMRVPVSAV